MEDRKNFREETRNVRKVWKSLKKSEQKSIILAAQIKFKKDTDRSAFYVVDNFVKGKLKMNSIRLDFFYKEISQFIEISFEQLFPLNSPSQEVTKDN